MLYNRQREDQYVISELETELQVFLTQKTSDFERLEGCLDERANAVSVLEGEKASLVDRAEQDEKVAEAHWAHLGSK